MRLHWGHGLAITMTMFIAFIVTMGINMGKTKVELEAKDYYERGLQHDQQLIMEKNTSQLGEKPFIVVDRETFEVKLIFPNNINGSMVSGTVEIYRPSDSKMDKKLEIGLIKNQQLLADSKIEKGIWDVKVHWAYAGNQYYFDKRINL